MTEANVETGKQIIPTVSKVLKKCHFFFQHYLRNQSAKDRTVKLYRRPRPFMHPVWMRVSGLIFGHRCVSHVYKARLFFCSPLDSMKLCADSQVLLFCIQPECRGSSACSWSQGSGTSRHKETFLQRPLFIRALWKDPYVCKRMREPCQGVQE